MAREPINFEIIDANGVIHSGTEEEMREAWTVMTGNVAQLSGLKDKRKELMEKWATHWTGDLKLIQVLAIEA